MKFEIIESEGEKYLSIVSKYTWDGYKCSLFRLFYVLPIKVYQKLFLRELGGNSITKMTNDTIFDYEHNSLKV